MYYVKCIKVNIDIYIYIYIYNHSIVHCIRLYIVTNTVLTAIRWYRLVYYINIGIPICTYVFIGNYRYTFTVLSISYYTIVGIIVVCIYVINEI